MNAWDEQYTGNVDDERAKLVAAQNDELRRQFRAAFLDTPGGRRVLTFLAAHGRLLASTYTGNAMSHFLEGRRDMVLLILDMCGIRDLQAVALLMNAAIEIQEEIQNVNRIGD